MFKESAANVTPAPAGRCCFTIRTISMYRYCHSSLTELLLLLFLFLFPVIWVLKHQPIFRPFCVDVVRQVYLPFDHGHHVYHGWIATTQEIVHRKEEK